MLINAGTTAGPPTRLSEIHAPTLVGGVATPRLVALVDFCIFGSAVPRKSVARGNFVGRGTCDYDG